MIQILQVPKVSSKLFELGELSDVTDDETLGNVSVFVVTVSAWLVSGIGPSGFVFVEAVSFAVDVCEPVGGTWIPLILKDNTNSSSIHKLQHHLISISYIAANPPPPSNEGFVIIAF